MASHTMSMIYQAKSISCFGNKNWYLLSIFETTLENKTTLINIVIKLLHVRPSFDILPTSVLLAVGWNLLKTAEKPRPSNFVIFWMLPWRNWWCCVAAWCDNFGVRNITRCKHTWYFQSTRYVQFQYKVLYVISSIPYWY